MLNSTDLPFARSLLAHSLKSVGSSITNADMLISLAYKDFDDSFDPICIAGPSDSSQLFPRPSSWSRRIRQFRQVPAQLQGIGLAHRGPAPQEEEEVRPDREEGTNSPTADGSGVSVKFNATIGNDVRQTFKELISRKTNKSVSNHVGRRVKSSDYHRAFSRRDIATWRSRYRPTVERAIAQMEENRRQWRAKYREGAGSDKAVVVGEGAGGTSVADTEDASTVSTLGDDCGVGGAVEGGDGHVEQIAGSGIEEAELALAEEEDDQS